MLGIKLMDLPEGMHIPEQFSKGLLGHLQIICLERLVERVVIGGEGVLDQALLAVLRLEGR